MKYSCLAALLLFVFVSTPALSQGAHRQVSLRQDVIPTPTQVVQKLSVRKVRCLAHIILTESRDEPEAGQYEAGWSAELRRLANLREYGGNDMCRVAYKITKRKKGGFTWQYDGAKVSVVAKVNASALERQAWDRSVYIAAMILQGQGRPRRPIMYFCDRRTPGACGWHDSSSRVRYAHTTGNHRMYTDKRFPEFSDLMVLASSR